jgi:hypothetical protein
LACDGYKANQTEQDDPEDKSIGRTEIEESRDGKEFRSEGRYALPPGTLFPIAFERTVLRAAKAGLSSFEALLFLGDEVHQPDTIKGFIEPLPLRRVDLPGRSR